MAKLATAQAVVQAGAEEYLDSEPAFAEQLRDYVVGQAQRLDTLAGQISDEHL